MRVFFIPGLGEETFIFDKIHPAIKGEKVFIDNWTLLAEVPEAGLTVLSYADWLIKKFDIKAEDVVIGHSMGGWIAVYIKQLLGCRIIQIATWTDSSKLPFIPLPNSARYWLVKNRLAFFDFALTVLVWLDYKNKPSEEIFKKVYRRLQTGDPLVAAKQLMVIFNAAEQTLTVQPDIRIHAKADKIVYPPDEYYIDVPGDHFSLYTFPETVYNPIVDFLKSN